MLRFLNQCRVGAHGYDGVTAPGAGNGGVVVPKHVMLLKPCALCIYAERCALFGVMGAGLVGAIAPKTPLRYVAMVIWIYSARRPTTGVYEHTMIQLHPRRS